MLLEAHHGPGSRLQAPFISVFHPHRNPGKVVLDPHFTDEETEAQSS